MDKRQFLLFLYYVVHLKITAILKSLFHYPIAIISSRCFHEQ